MIIIRKEDREHFKEFGWVSVSMGLTQEEVYRYFSLVKKIKETAILKKYKNARIYYDYLTVNNLAAIELPFNREVFPSELKTLFEKISLGEAVLNLMSWKDAYCSLARLFCMTQYNYRGRWHRDFELRQNSISCEDRVQVGIYLTAQYGFRLLKKEYDLGGRKTFFRSPEDSLEIENSGEILQPPRNSYFTVGGEAGTVLFFNPLILHQGSSSTYRYDFHMRFDRLDDFQINHLGQNSFQDFKIVRHLLNSPELNLVDVDKLPILEKKSILLRTLNQANYYIPLINLVKYALERKQFKSVVMKNDLLANTAYQNND